MAAAKNEAILSGKLDEHIQTTVYNATGAELAPEEVFVDYNREGNTVAMVAAETIASTETGEAFIRGEFEVKANSADTFEIGDEVWWDRSANEAVDSTAKAGGDFRLGLAASRKTSSDSTVRVRLNEPAYCSSQSSTSTSSSSTSSSSTSSSSTSA